MGFPTSLTDPSALLIADSSVMINLIATGCASEILRALPIQFLVTDIVVGELATGRRRGRRDAELLEELVGDGIVRIVALDDVAITHFEQLVIGPTAMTLDDGEAATIAYSLANSGVPVIDERKAKRICAERFPSLSLACSVDIFAHEDVFGVMGSARLAQAVVNALQNARMRVLPHHRQWVLDLIGSEHAARCMSLPRSIRAMVR